MACITGGRARREDGMRMVKALAISLVCTISALVAGFARPAAQGGLTITTLSSRPDMVSGGDALVEVKTSATSSVVVTLNGKDVSQAFHADPARGSLVGLVDGLRAGGNVIVAKAGSRTARLDVTNFPITGPIVSGPHLTPFVCKTVESGLGEPLDADCSAPTRIEYFYKSMQEPASDARGRGPAASAFKPLADPAIPPADVARTTTSEGKTVPYIVRVESGTINRAIYRIAMLADPAGWNHRLLFSFGGGCGTNYNQGTNQATSVLSDAPLSRGFAYATSTQNVLQQHCNDKLSGEALMMIKEHVIERYGVPKWTMGIGGSGGSIQQLLIAQGFPGLLDGLLPSLTFPDSTSIEGSVTDCRLLVNYFKNDPTVWTKEKQVAVEGYSAGTCEAWDRSFVNIIVADRPTGCGITPELVYDPVKNPKGARCTTWDTSVALFGRDPATGFARRTLDNVGVQYGLRALNSGAITKSEFLDLNAKIGGFDNDGHARAERTVGDPEAVRLAYAAGRIDQAAGGLSSMPILHYRSYNDATGDIHTRERDFTMRERLRKANGRVDNQVIWVIPNGSAGLAASVNGLAIDTMSQWLDGLTADTSAAPSVEKVKKAKPAAAVDACWTAEGAKIEEPATFDGPGTCNALYPSHTTPRLVAGANLTDDVLKCQLKPIEPKDYQVTFSAGELQQLRAIFSGGVCDYSKPSVNQRPMASTYLKLPLKSPASATSSAAR